MIHKMLTTIRHVHLPNLNKSNIANVRKMIHARRPNVPCKSMPFDVSYVSCLVGKSIILFTLFYTSMNWFMYRNIRKDIEKNTEKDNESDKS